VLFLGHIAISLLVADRTDSDRAAAVAGNLVPDVVDKTGSWVLKLLPSGRWLAHGLPFTFLTIALARPFLDDRRWRGFALGYLCHLFADLWQGGQIPWLAPFKSPPKRRQKRTFMHWFLYLLPEVVGGAIIWRILDEDRPTG
jgi:membrane-bound metal-dependent hydrolase YbcI (DUF457 family)